MIVMTYLSVIHWLTSPETSHSLTALAQCNHHLVVLLYFKLQSELRNHCYTRTDNDYSTRQYPSSTSGFCISLLLSRFFWELTAFLKDCRISHCGSNTDPVSLFVWITQCLANMISKEIYLNLSKFVDNLLVVKNLLSIRHFIWKD